MNTTLTRTQATKKDIMIQALLAKLPAEKVCPKCGEKKATIEEFGTRVTHKDGVPVRAQAQSYCRSCRTGTKSHTGLGQPAKQKAAPAPVVVMSWSDAVVLSLTVKNGAGETVPLSLAAIYAGIESMGSMSAAQTNNKNWKAKVRQQLQLLAKKGLVKAEGKGTYRLVLG